jgi:hypothetical protein
VSYLGAMVPEMYSDHANHTAVISSLLVVAGDRFVPVLTGDSQEATST